MLILLLGPISAAAFFAGGMSGFLWAIGRPIGVDAVAMLFCVFWVPQFLICLHQLRRVLFPGFGGPRDAPPDSDSR
jgi:hypothetical protein